MVWWWMWVDLDSRGGRCVQLMQEGAAAVAPWCVSPLPSSGVHAPPRHQRALVAKMQSQPPQLCNAHAGRLLWRSAERAGSGDG